MATNKNKPGAKVAAKEPSTNEIRLVPSDAVLLVGNTYTAEVILPDNFSEDLGDVVTFSHPAGWDVKAAVTGKVATGTFLIERARQFDFGFKINGKKVASASYETRDA